MGLLVTGQLQTAIYLRYQLNPLIHNGENKPLPNTLGAPMGAKGSSMSKPSFFHYRGYTLDGRPVPLKSADSDDIHVYGQL